MRRLRPWIVACLLCTASTAWGHPDIDEAKKAFARGEFKLALLRLEKAERAPDRSEEETVELYWYRGAALHRLGEKTAANKSFDVLLASRPLHEPDKYEVAPDLRSAFAARASAYDAQFGVRLGAPALRGDVLVVTVEKNADRVAALKVFSRVRGDQAYQPATWRVEGGQASGPVGNQAVWERLERAGTLEVTMEAINDRGAPVARLGDAVNPKPLEVTPAAARSVLDALTALNAPAPQPATETTGTAAAPDTAAPASSPLRMPLLGGGGAALAAGGVALLITLLTVVGALGSWGAFVGTWYALSNRVGVQAGSNYATLTRIYQYSLWPAVLLSGAGGLLLLLTLAAGGAGGALLAAAFVVD